jgi:uncharacterized membrane protein
MKTAFIISLCLFFVGCTSNKNEIAEQEKVSAEGKFDSVLIDSINKIQTEKIDYIDSVQLRKSFSKIGVWEIHGTEPFWNIKIINEKIIFTKLNEKIDTVYFKVNDFLFIDGGISFELIDENKSKVMLNILKKAEKISDGMSDKLYDYAARLKYNNIELKGVAEKK